MIIVNCPICAKEVIFSKENKYRPFCSQRCRKIDLGEWADEKKAIAGVTGEALLQTNEWEIDERNLY